MKYSFPPEAVEKIHRVRLRPQGNLILLAGAPITPIGAISTRLYITDKNPQSFLPASFSSASKH